MAFSRSRRSDKVAQDFSIYGEDEAIVLSGSFANVLEIDFRELRTATLILRLDHASIDGDYQIFATTKENAGSTVTADHWVPETASTALTHEVNVEKVFTGKNYSKIIVQAKADSGTPTLKAWFRGDN